MKYTLDNAFLIKKNAKTIDKISIFDKKCHVKTTIFSEILIQNRITKNGVKWCAEAQCHCKYLYLGS